MLDKGFLQQAGLSVVGWNSCLFSPKPLLNKDINVKLNKQKFSDVCPAQTMLSDKKPLLQLTNLVANLML